MSVEKKVWKFNFEKALSIDRRNATRARMNADIGIGPMEAEYELFLKGNPKLAGYVEKVNQEYSSE